MHAFVNFIQLLFQKPTNTVTSIRKMLIRNHPLKFLDFPRTKGNIEQRQA